MSVYLMILVCLNMVKAFSEDIKGPPIAQQKEIKKIVRLGEDVKVQCPISGNPIPIIEWKKGGETIDYSWIRIRTKNKSMKIKKSQVEDTGTYICKGVNGFGNVEVRVDLIVIDPSKFPDLKEGELPDVSPPEFTAITISSKSYYHKKSGESFRVTCEASGNPQPEIFWYKDGLPFDADGIRYRDGRSTIKLKNLMKVDTAIYTCQARNLVGIANKNYTLHVEIPSSEEPTVTGNGNMTVFAGGTASFQCKVKSTAPPHIKWLKKQGPETPQDLFTINVGEERYKVIHTGEDIAIGTDGYLNKLVIHDVQEQDAGLYICFVTNSVGSFNYKPSYLHVFPAQSEIERHNYFAGSNGESTSILVLVISLGIIVALILIFIIACVVKKNHKAGNDSIDSPEVIRSLMAPSSSTQSNSTITTVSGNNKFEQPLPPPPSMWGVGNNVHNGNFIGREFSNSLHENSSTNLLSDRESPVSGGDPVNNMYEVPYCHEYGVVTSKGPNNSLYTISQVPGVNTTLASTGTMDTEGGRYPFRHYPYFQYLNSDYDSY